MGLDFKTNDIINSKEDEIERIISKKSITANISDLAQYIKENKDIIMTRTLLSMLYKTRSKSIYMKDKIAESRQFEQDTIYMSEELIKIIYITLNRRGIKDIKRVLLENAGILNEILLKYYSEKNTNYIEEKFFLETIMNQNGEKEILVLNPFMISQLLDYKNKPLTYEEKIIREIIDYYVEAQQYYDSPKDIRYVEKLLSKNNHIKEMVNKKSYMMSNVYQQSKKYKDEKFSKNISKIFENKNLHDIEIYNFLSLYYESEITKKFIEYNMNIEEGKIEELEKQPSAVFAKILYKKK